MTRRPFLAIATFLLLASSAVPSALAAGGTLYVDGKTGSDANDGHTPSEAFKTIAKAASKIPTGSSAAGWVVSVKGYTDHVYRERAIPPGWDRHGTASAPIVFQATGYRASSSGYVKPIVSGADLAPRSGERWVASGTTGVWKTPWPTKPVNFGTYSGSIKTALFQDKTTWLWEQTSLSALASKAKTASGGYYWSGGWLYASGKGTTDPSKHTVDVIMRNTFLFMGTNGVSAVQIRGFEVRHSANGIALLKGIDHSTIADNVLIGNLMMGIVTSGGQTSSGPNPATDNMVARNKASYNTLQAIKIDEGSQDSTYCDNTAQHNGLQGIKVQGPPGGTSYTGTTTGITICRNTLAYNDFNPTGSVYTNTSGLTIANGARNVTVDSNLLFNNLVGIHITQESSGRAAMTGIALKRNQVHDNKRYGIYFYDGAKGTTAGKGSMRSDYDVVWDNGTGILVGRASTNKTIAHATVFSNTHDGIKVGEAGQSAAKATISSTLVTNNGGYGLWLITGSSASLSYVGLSANTLGSTKGTPSKTAVNTKAAGYLSTTEGSSNYLKIGASSYQYTAGPSASPVGARY